MPPPQKKKKNVGTGRITMIFEVLTDGWGDDVRHQGRWWLHRMASVSLWL